jgi:hypothetical protein
MATTPPAPSASKTVPSSRNLAHPAEAKAAKRPLFSAALLAGWLIPGAGHVIAKRYGRAAILFVTIGLMFVLGLLMQGKLYVANLADPLSMLGFIGDLGSGLLYIGGRLFGVGQTPVQVVTADYGTKFIVVAGLLNIIAAVDAHNLRIGRKQ